ncbi:Hypothetical protein NTJ_16213 [Nesidiocoris tenuis]|uniref:Uncharacterized protein n=1 Tax=Nesidiocoris tenuis TaxID=355587 RepID=A0ABN7BHR5_9HEMI|nr:Hypothetical protein NTJ_16213 [Nesidiocoris tenuis]
MNKDKISVGGRPGRRLPYKPLSASLRFVEESLLSPPLIWFIYSPLAGLVPYPGEVFPFSFRLTSNPNSSSDFFTFPSDPHVKSRSVIRKRKIAE